MSLAPESSELGASPSPITAICIIADKNRAPAGFQTITRSHDDGSDADLWRESGLSSWFSRPVRYVAVSREEPKTALPGGVTVVTDLTIVNEKDPIPHGFVAIDYTADSREKALRKRFLCVKTEPRDVAIDAVGEVVVITKTKKTPKGFTSAGEVDGALICYRVIVIPPSFGNLPHSSSTGAIPGGRTNSLYPSVTGENMSSSAPQLDANGHPLNAFTIKTAAPPIRLLDGVPFKVNPRLVSGGKGGDVLPAFKEFDLSRLDSSEFSYNFNLERSTLANM